METRREREPGRNLGGRPEGSVNRLSREARARAEATGLLPHEILLSMARGEPQRVVELDSEGNAVEREVAVDLDTRKDAAKAAAPYYAPRITAVELTKGMAEDDLDAIIAQFAAQAGIAALSGGEGAKGAAPQGEDGDDAPPRRARGRRRVEL